MTESESNGLTKEESAWIRKLNKLLAQCPSSRLGFYTTGDPSITVYDNSREHEFNTNIDLPMAVDAMDAYLGDIKFPANVASTVG